MTATIAMVHEMRVLDHTGDTRTVWSPDVQAEIDAAKAQFEKLHKAGYLAYKVDTDGGAAEQLHEFDPSAGMIIMRPQLVGG